MRPSAFAAFLITSLALTSVLFVCSGCGNDNTSKPRVTDEQLIQQTIDSWIELLEEGDDSGLIDLYEVTAWQSSPTKSEWTRLAGKTPVASDVNISVSGDTASATFVATTSEDEQIHVAWTLHKVSDLWKITSEEWS